MLPIGGFPLIESLIVIRIRATLASMLPAVSLVRESVASTSCRETLRQFGIANAAYAGDWDGCSVSGTDCDGVGPWSNNWYGKQAYTDFL